ncbi:hypothetical protein KGA66_20470 [Actinocrinis puniceicyclus]|uniref:Siderophore synthetase component n=1 Tax=Actinocrinis puniceicyclus TaxID=977794 RepID=A0A8J8BDM8_9ACTN|nr:IucA/IucC family protein [Actinocrinis puniceicyclus]MBS2965438.1 hypothetical protein [Actinocrinis puniceicyclus]
MPQDLPVTPAGNSAPPDAPSPDHPAERLTAQPPDPVQPALAHRRAADHLAAEALLRCWVRERGLAATAAGERLVLDLGDSVLHVPIEYWSPTGMHRFGVPHGALGPVGPGTLARLLGECAAARGDVLQRFVARAAQSAARIAGHIEARSAGPRPAQPATPFLTAEQGLIAGHPLHPMPKSREPLSAAEAARYSPELRGCFPLHWFAVADEIAVHDSELGPSAPDLLGYLSGLIYDAQPGSGRVLVPAHPWQAGELLRRDNMRELIAAGAVEYLGEGGPPWYPTSSLRTMYRPDQPVMLKLSLALRIAGSRRENPRRELLRGVEAHRLLSGPLGARLLAAHPGFRALTDAGFLATEGVPGLDVSIRHSPFRRGEHVYCIAALTDLGREAVAGDGHPHELAAHLHGLAALERRPVRAVAMQWFARYITSLIAPVFWLDAEHGVTLDAHQQNTMIQLDAQGYPGAGWYRGNRGFSYRVSCIDRLEAVGGVPGLGRASESVVADEVATQRLVNHVGINNLMGVAGAIGCARIVDERELLGLAADLLAPLRGHLPVDLLLGADTLSCDANLLSSVAGTDESVGEPAARRFHVEISNPIPGTRRSVPSSGAG